MTQEAKKFVEFWTYQRGSEKGEDQKFGSCKFLVETPAV